PEARKGLAVGLIVGGAFAVLGGVTGQVLGGIMTTTGIGALLGVPAIAVSTTLVAGGVGNIAAGIRGLMTTGSGSGAQRGPKTDPNAPHNAKIREEAAQLKAEGNTIVGGGGEEREKLMPTPGGTKEGRRPDILYRTPRGELRGRNVGRTNANGTPVRREV